MDRSKLELFARPLLEWYEVNRRILPFRENPRPYYIWVSEIMLQQTRVSAAVPYFERFVAVLPDIRALAECDEGELLKLWQGLGYYNRVRNLQKGAREVCERFGGELPADETDLKSITGIGDYTAGAIGSIAFGLKTPAVDGNVLRVVARLCADERDIADVSLRKEYADLLRVQMPDGREGDFTQAIMELGALVCVPNGVPHCEECPLSAICKARADGLTDHIPYKSKKKERAVQKRSVYLVVCGERVLLHRRPRTGLLAGLWEFPNFLLNEELPPEFAKLNFRKDCSAKHIFSHVEWHMQSHLAKCTETFDYEDGIWVTLKELEEIYAVPGAFSTFCARICEIL